MVDILHRVGIKASPDEVYKALATREGLAGWWTTDTQGDSTVGGVLALSLPCRRRRDRRLRHEGARASIPPRRCCGKWSTGPQSGSARASAGT